MNQNKIHASEIFFKGTISCVCFKSVENYKNVPRKNVNKGFIGDLGESGAFIQKHRRHLHTEDTARDESNRYALSGGAK